MINPKIQELLDKKAKQNNSICLDTYAAGLTDMFNSLNASNATNAKSNEIPVLGTYEFRCGNCEKIHKMPMYAVAQISMGHTIIHSCECGHKNELKSFND